jgi:hypothetical protein
LTHLPPQSIFIIAMQEQMKKVLEQAARLQGLVAQVKEMLGDGDLGYAISRLF